VSDHLLLINGRLEEGAHRLCVLNPATEKVGATCARASEAQLEADFFIEPTIVRYVTEGLLLVDEEQFGPALPVIRF